MIKVACRPLFTVSMEETQAWYQRVSNSTRVFAILLYMRMSFLESLPVRIVGFVWNFCIGPSIRL